MDFRFTLSVFALLSLFLFVPTASAATLTYDVCNTNHKNSDVEGYGGAQVCGVAYPCGIADGVCPMEYATNSSEEVTVMMRYGNDTIDSDIGYDTADTTVFTTGGGACDSVAGKFVRVEESDDRDSWSNTGLSETDDITSEDPAWYRAVCNATPETAGCKNCPDPDCGTQIDVLAYDKQNDSGLEGVNVALFPEHQEYYETSGDSSDISREVVTNGSGEVTISSAHRGNFHKTCYKQGYDIVREENITMSHGGNTIFCPMECSVTLNETDLQDMGYTDDDLNTSSLSEHSECVVEDSNNPGTAVCTEQCKGEDCSIGTIPEACGGQELGTQIFQGINSDGNRTYMECCTGNIIEKETATFELTGSNISDLITRNFRKELNGRAVNLKVITYQTED